jgi:Hint domain
VSDSTFTWNGGTGSASDETNWTVTGPANSPNVPLSNDSIVITTGDAQFTNTPIPGPDNTAYGGTVFFQGGTIDMINSGGTAGILQQTLMLVSNTVAANATLTSQGDSTNFGTIDADLNGTLTFAVLSGVATNAGTIEATNGGSVQIFANGGASFVNTGTVIANGGGSVLISGSLGGTGGYFAMGSPGPGGGTIEVNAPVTSQGMIFDFPDAGLLKLDQVSTFHGDINEPGGGDFVDLGLVNVATIVVSSTGAGDGTINLTLEDAGSGTLGSFFVTPFNGDIFNTGTFAVAGDGTAGANFTFSVGSGSDEVMAIQTFPCFMEGTRISTEHGEVAVEDLIVGDRVPTVIGKQAGQIIWIGHRTVDCSQHPNPKLVWPVRVSAGAFGRGKPSRDLWLSPDHAVYVEDVLIPVKHLINGSSITQVPQASVTYYHIELQRHDVVLANGLPAESYLAGADRSVFANNGGPVALYPDLSSRVWEAEGCAPLVVTGPSFEAARRCIRLPGRGITRSRNARAA